jgi:Fic family protein
MRTLLVKIEKKMTKNFSIWNPGYAITSEIARDLMSIESAKTVIDNTPFPPTIENELRRQARVKSTHYSTQIEGNRLTLKQAEEVINEHKYRLQGRERDVAEVRNYWKALICVEEWAAKHVDFSEGLIKMIHGMVMKGRKTKPSDYRDGQNVIRDSSSGKIVYMPPEAKDEALRYAEKGIPVEHEKLRRLDRRARTVLSMFLKSEFVTAGDVASALGLSNRTARLLIQKWVEDGFFSVANSANRSRKYRLSAIYR